LCEYTWIHHMKAEIESDTSLVHIARTFPMSVWSQLGMNGFSATITIQKTGTPVAIVHLIRSHVCRFLIDVTRNCSVAISASRSLNRRGYASGVPRPTSGTARRFRIRIGDRSIRLGQTGVAL